METKLNLELLKKVRDRIAEVPESYEQRTWRSDSKEAPCGSAACLFGEAVICDSTTVKSGIARLRRYINGPTPMYVHGERILGLSREDALRMCDYMPLGDAQGLVVRWPEPYATRFTRAKTPKARAKVAVAYLTECLKRKAVTW